jgi:hypothetical protein
MHKLPIGLLASANLAGLAPTASLARDYRYSVEIIRVPGIGRDAPPLQVGFATEIVDLDTFVGLDLNESFLSSTEAQVGRWISRRGVVTRLGLTNGLHQGPQGFAWTEALVQPTTRVTVGVSFRGHPMDAEDVFSTAWFFDGVGYRTIGLEGPQYIASDGLPHATILSTNARGEVLGLSNFGDSRWAGDPFLWRDGRAIRVGPSGRDFVGQNGLPDVSAHALLDDGTIIGSATRFLAPSRYAHIPWIRRPWGELQFPGLRSRPYVGKLGEESHWWGAMHPDGRFAVGSSNLAARHDWGATSAWLWHDGVTTRVGLDGPDFVGPSGYEAQRALRVNARGDVAGTARMLSAPGHASRAWLWRDGVASVAGIYRPEHVGPSLASWTILNSLSDDGAVLGESIVYRDTESLGRTTWGSTTWIHRDGQTTEMGLFDAEHTFPDGRRSSNVHQSQPWAGKIVGASRRAATTNRHNELATAWWHDIATGITNRIPCQVGGVPADSVEVWRVTPTGNVLLGAEGPWGKRTFIWSLAGGLRDLDAQVPGGFASLGLGTSPGISVVLDDLSILAGSALEVSTGRTVPIVLRRIGCIDVDFNNDGVYPELEDLAAFLGVLGGGACAGCDTADFNGDGASGDDRDLRDFLLAMGGQSC